MADKQQRPKSLPPGAKWFKCTRCKTKYISYMNKPGICDTIGNGVDTGCYANYKKRLAE